MFHGKTVSLVIPAYNEEVTITAVVEEFRTNPVVDEIIVADNNCNDRTVSHEIHPIPPFDALPEKRGENTLSLIKFGM